MDPCSKVNMIVLNRHYEFYPQIYLANNILYKPGYLVRYRHKPRAGRLALNSQQWKIFLCSQ
jgi:hypothetical protein